ncbi:MAG: FecR domain-containing protein [Cyanobacteria bacterium P01_H01_bin.119]
MKRRFYLLTALGALATAIWGDRAQAQDAITVRANRWLEVRQLSGQTFTVAGGQRQSGRIGQRLQRAGDGISTRRNASAILAIDTTVGFIQVSENTDLEIVRMRSTARGGRITELIVRRGQARVQTRPFTNPDTRLDLRTPAGVSGVRGTVFGISVHPDGRTGVATEEGQVISAAEGTAVEVDAGLQTLIFPGEAPLPPTPLRDDPQLNLQMLRAIDNQQVEIIGRTDPVNLLIFEGEAQVLERSGDFRLTVPLPSDRNIQLTVLTPLGTEQVYRLRVP